MKLLSGGTDIKLLGGSFIIVGMVDAIIIVLFPDYALKLFGTAVTGPASLLIKLHSPLVQLLIGYGFVFLRPWGVRPRIGSGERAAQARLRWFVDGPIHRYVDGRNQPAMDGSSKLSPHFRFGTLSPLAAVHAALRVLARGGHVSRPDVLTWIDELIWREFFQQVLASFPRRKWSVPTGVCAFLPPARAGT
jgi:hypothetical protein